MYVEERVQKKLDECFEQLAASKGIPLKVAEKEKCPVYVRQVRIRTAFLLTGMVLFTLARAWLWP
jgi:hypothetical protein